MYAVSVDIGGTQTRVASVDKNGTILNKISFSTESQDPILNLKKIQAVIESFNKNFVAVGMSCPGPLDLKKGIVLTPPNLPGWQYFPLKEESEKIMNLPIFIENDANLAGFAESQIGAGKGRNIVQYLTISTGIGGSLVINDEIFIGANGFAQEIANSILWKNGPQQGSLKSGSLESISSGTAITKRAKKVGLNVDHAGDVNKLALKGNVNAKVIMEEAKEYLANMLGIIVALIDPNVIILGGGVALKIPGFVEEIESRLKEKVFKVQQDNINVIKAQLGDDNGLIGGALYAFNKIGDK